MHAWGNTWQPGPGPSRSRSGNDKPGMTMGLAFGGVALVAVAICSLLLMVQRHEQRKLVDRIKERDGKIEEMQARVEGSGREAVAALEESRRAAQALTQFEAGARQQELAWAELEKQLRQERQDLEDQLDEAKDAEEAREAQARESVRKSDVMTLPLRAVSDPCLTSSATFNKAVTVETAGSLPGQLRLPATQAAEDGLVRANVPLSPSGYHAWVSVRIHGRTMPSGATTSQVVCIEASLMVVQVTTDLATIAWLPCVTEIDVFGCPNTIPIEPLVRERVGAIVEALALRGLRGGPAGQLANGSVAPTPTTPGATPAQPTAAPPSTPGAPPASAPPSPPSPGGGTQRPPKP